jgi:hypothetical protein
VWVLWIAGGLLVWTVVAVLVGLALGKVLGHASEAELHGPAGWRHADRTAAPPRHRRVRPPTCPRLPGVRPPSRPAGCRRCPSPSAAVPAASSEAVDVSHLPAEGPHQPGDETADPGCGLVQPWRGCVSPPRSVEGSAVLAAPRPIRGGPYEGEVPVRAPAAGACPSATAMLARGDVALMA